MEKQDNDVTPLAVTDWKDIRKVFGIKAKNRRGHIYITGKTGSGKSNLIGNMVVSDLKQGNGLALIDPHGDLAEAVLDFVPDERVDDVIYFNPADLDYPIPFNPLRKVAPDFRSLVASGLISVFKKIWPEFWGPRLEHILRYSILTLLEYPNGTLLELPKLLTNKEFRKVVLTHIKEVYVREFWLLEFEKYSTWFKSEATSPILNKIGQFLASVPLRNCVGQSRNTFDLREVMDSGKILIANLGRGKIGEDGSALLGAMLVTRIQLAAMSRADIPERERKPFYLYVDEFHDFVTLAFADILSESRKYGLNLTLAHQYQKQLDEKLRSAILGNVGTMIAFRLSAEDASVIANEFYPYVSETDLTNLPNHHVYLRLMVEGSISRPFSAMTLSMPEVSESRKDEVIQRSRTRYGRPRIEVEQEIRLRSAHLNQKPPQSAGGLFI